jgi:hypothetical protein
MKIDEEVDRLCDKFTPAEILKALVFRGDLKAFMADHVSIICEKGETLYAINE